MHHPRTLLALERRIRIGSADLEGGEEGKADKLLLGSVCMWWRSYGVPQTIFSPFVHHLIIDSISSTDTFRPVFGGVLILSLLVLEEKGSQWLSWVGPPAGSFSTSQWPPSWLTQALSVPMRVSWRPWQTLPMSTAWSSPSCCALLWIEKLGLGTPLSLMSWSRFSMKWALAVCSRCRSSGNTALRIITATCFRWEEQQGSDSANKCSPTTFLIPIARPASYWSKIQLENLLGVEGSHQGKEKQYSFNWKTEPLLCPYWGQECPADGLSGFKRTPLALEWPRQKYQVEVKSVLAD